MSSINKSRTQTAFTISIESKKGVTTGISAHDRAKTIKVAIKPNVKEKHCFTWSCVSLVAKRWRSFGKGWPYRSFC